VFGRLTGGIVGDGFSSVSVALEGVSVAVGVFVTGGGVRRRIGGDAGGNSGFVAGVGVTRN
jgi:hypothetical protein